MTPPATLFLIVGLPGAGKTTRARELEKAHRALRFSPDEWMIPLFGESEADGKRDLLEGLLAPARFRSAFASSLGRRRRAGGCTLARSTRRRVELGRVGSTPMANP